MATINFQKLKGRETIILQKQPEFDSGYEALPPGIYRLDIRVGIFDMTYLFNIQKQRDTLIRFKTGIVEEVIERTSRFFSERTIAAYKELKMFHSMGMLFHGPPGTGKTCTCQLIMEELCVKYGAICLDCTGKGLGLMKLAVQKIREVQDSPIILFVDEADVSIRQEEDLYLPFLDGTDSIDNTIFIGCTNRIEKIPDRIKYRKSRIKHLFEIKSFPLDVYKEYVIDRLPSLGKEEIFEFAFKAEEKGLTLDQLKHSIIDFKLEGTSIDDSIIGVINEGPPIPKSATADDIIYDISGEDEEEDPEDEDDPDN